MWRSWFVQEQIECFSVCVVVYCLLIVWLLILASLIGSSSVSSPSPPSPKHRCETDPRPFMPGPQAAPFLRVQQVIEGSPAARGGLRNQDLVIRLGSITGSNFSGNLNSIVSLLAGYQGQVLGVEVLRETAPNNPLRLSLTPQVWSGRGLLGCKMLPLLPPPWHTAAPPNLCNHKTPTLRPPRTFSFCAACQTHSLIFLLKLS